MLLFFSKTTSSNCSIIGYCRYDSRRERTFHPCANIFYSMIRFLYDFFRFLKHHLISFFLIIKQSCFVYTFTIKCSTFLCGKVVICIRCWSVLFCFSLFCRQITEQREQRSRRTCWRRSAGRRPMNRSPSSTREPTSWGNATNSRRKNLHGRATCLLRCQQRERK